MKRHLRSYVLVLLMSLFVAAAISYSYEAGENDCGARCTGSSYCSACKNCSRCQHCNSGGTCGVCAPRKPEPKVNKEPKGLVVDREYAVIPSKLNVREKPSRESAIVYTLKQGAPVQVMEILSHNWVKIKFSTTDGRHMSGYVLGTYLK